MKKLPPENAHPSVVFPLVICFLQARALGFEPRSKVLETRMLPLHHARINELANQQIRQLANSNSKIH